MEIERYLVRFWISAVSIGDHLGLISVKVVVVLRTEANVELKQEDMKCVLYMVNAFKDAC